MGIQQLGAPFLCTTPLGEATCHFVYDGSDETYWGCFQKQTCELWWWRGHEFRYAVHISEGFTKQSPIVLPPETDEALKPHRKPYATALKRRTRTGK